LPTIDIIGLTDETVAHKGLSHSYLQKVSPDLYILQNLYLTTPDASTDGAITDYCMMIADELQCLDMDSYRTIVADAERRHSGRGSTFQVFTMPIFSQEYQYLAQFAFGKDTYFFFIRKDYVYRGELAAIIEAETRT